MIINNLYKTSEVLHVLHMSVGDIVFVELDKTNLIKKSM